MKVGEGRGKTSFNWVKIPHTFPAYLRPYLLFSADLNFNDCQKIKPPTHLPRDGNRLRGKRLTATCAFVCISLGVFTENSPKNFPISCSSSCCCFARYAKWFCVWVSSWFASSSFLFFLVISFTLLFHTQLTLTLSPFLSLLQILDASLYSSQSLATSAMIAVFSLLLLLIVLISSLFVWK